jgi:hypothetical protein
VFNPDSNVTVDGVPNDATGLDDIGEGDGGDVPPDIDAIPDIETVRDGEVTSASVREMSEGLPNDVEQSAYWKSAPENPVPSKGQPVVTQGDETGIMLDVTGDFPDHSLVLMTGDGETETPSGEITHLFDRDADPSEGEVGQDQTEENPTDPSPPSMTPDEIRTSVSVTPDVSDEVDEYAENADSPQMIGNASFEDEIGVFGITKEEVVEEGVDVPRFSASGASSEDQARNFMEATLQARERGWMDDLDGGIKMPSGNLDLPAGALGTFKPGIRNFAGEEIRSTERRKAEINISADLTTEWDGKQEYIPFGPETASALKYTVNHEFGHHLHYKNLIEERGYTVNEVESDEVHNELRDQLREYEDEITDEFSAHQAYNAFEFAADTFAALSVGADVSDEVLEAYEKIGGVVP